MKRIVLLSILFSLLLSGCRLIPEDEEAIAPLLKKPQEIQFATQTVKKGTIEKKIEAFAQFAPTKQFSLCFKDQGGRLKSVYFKAGDKVKKGDVIAELYTDDLKGQLDELDIAVDKLKIENEYKETSIKRNMEFSGQKLARLKNKYETNDDFSKDELYNMVNNMTEAEIEYDNLKDSYSSILKQDELDVKLFKMQRDKLAEKFDRVRIISPVLGDVVFLDGVKLGNDVTANKAFAVIASSSELQLQYTGNDYSAFKVGADVNVEINGGQYEGRVAMTPDNAPEDSNIFMTNTVIIKIDNIPEGVKIGDSADIKLILQKKEDVIVIQKSLIHKYKDSDYVYILEQGVRKEKQVETGIETATEVEIINGLNVGDKLIQ